MLDIVALEPELEDAPELQDTPDIQDTEATDDYVVIIATHLDGQARTAAFAYAKAGNHIVIASDNDEAAVLLANELLSRHVDATFVHADTRNQHEIERVIGLAEKHYGHIDIQYRQ